MEKRKKMIGERRRYSIERKRKEQGKKKGGRGG